MSCVHRQPAGGRVIPVTILHTNDVHGYAWPIKRADGRVRGGFAVQAIVVERVRKELEQKGGITLVLSGGDVNTGFPDSDVLEARPDFEAMNRIGYDAMALGNHDLDGGRKKLEEQIGWAKFPILSANVKPLLASSTVIERRGVKIGIIGLTTPSLKKIALPMNVEDLDVEDPIKAAKEEVRHLEDRGLSLLVALTHVGIMPTIPNDDIALAKEVPELAAIVGGHTHTLLPHGRKVGRTMVVQAGEKGEYLGRLDLLWDVEKREVVQSSASVIPLGLELGEDPEVKKLLDGYRVQVATKLDEELGQAEVDLLMERHSVQKSESNLADFICDVLRETTGSDVAVYNSGGIRASIAHGPIRLRDVLRVLPFHNTVVTGFIRGKRLREALQTGVSNRQRSGSFLQVSGLSYQIENEHVLEVYRNGHPLRDDERLKMAANNFIVTGGDYLEEFKSLEATEDSGVPVDEVVANYLRLHPRVRTKLQGRISIRP